MIAGFALVILLSLALALLSRRGHGGQDARGFFTASGQFGALLLFILSVGETYSVASLLGFPGGVYAHGDGFSAWFFGYILMVAPLLFFVGPWIARAGALYRAATIADFFARHFESRALERVVALAAIVALVPVGTMQFLGLRIVLATLAPGAPPLLLAGGAGLIAFFYVAVAGLRASAFVAILKDLLMIGAILLVGGAALAGWRHGLAGAAGVGGVTGAAGAAGAVAAPIAAHDRWFAVTTILVQAAGYAMLPQTWSFLFAARSAQAIRRAQLAAPLYMMMFPPLMIVATYAALHGLHPPAPDHVFLTVAAALLPAWLLGIVLAGVALAGLVLLSTVCLAIGSLVTRNLLAGLGEARQQRWAKAVTALYLLLSILSAEASGRLMATMNNLIYFGIVQLVPGFVAALCLARVPAIAVAGGILAGDALAIGLFAAAVPLGGVNPGLAGLAANLLVAAVLTRLAPRGPARTVVQQLRDRATGRPAGDGH